MFNQRERILAHLSECYSLDETLIERVRPLVDRMLSAGVRPSDRAHLYELLVRAVQHRGQQREEALARFVFGLERALRGNAADHRLAI